MSYDVDIDIDWNEEDDTGLPWTFIDSAAVPERVVPGAYLVAGRGTAVAVAEVVDVGDDGVVQLRPLPGLVAEHLHLVTSRRSA
jgi:hypothetical protein